MNRRRLLSFLAFAPLAAPAAIAATCKAPDRFVTPAFFGAAPHFHTGDLHFDLKGAPIRTIAKIMKASRQILDDAPRLQSYIDSQINYRVVRT
jgi:hypothetical protein